MHLDKNKVVGLDASTGSLGHGLSIALGMALGGRLLGKNFKAYCLLGDGECNEGSVWEAAMAIAHFKATNVITIIDRNKCMIDGRTEDVMGLEPFADKWEAFGFEVRTVDGHDLYALTEVLDYAIKAENKPVAIIADTLKGCGVADIQDDYRYHYASVSEDAAAKYKKQIDEYHDKRLKLQEKSNG